MPDVLRRAARLIPLAGVLAAFVALPAAAEKQQFTATATDLKSGKLVYTEVYDVEVEQGRWVSGTTRYALPDGKQIAERRFDFSRDRYVPVFDYAQTDVEYQEGITRVDPKGVDVFMVRDGARQTASLARAPVMVGDCGSQAFLIDNLGKLDQGETLHFTLVVAGRVDSFGLRARKLEDVTVNGKRALRVRIELDNVLRLVLPTLELVIDPESKRMIEYSGIANVKDPSTRKSYSVKIAFKYK